MEEQYDDMLFEMLKECKTLPEFLDSIFGFLKRRTDFYHISTDKNSPVGLPPGVAEQVVTHIFNKWKPDPMPKIENENQVPDIAQEVSIECTLENSDTDDGIKPTNTTDDPTNTTVGAVDNRIINFSSSECYNGAVFDNYSWSQNINEIDITIKTPVNLTSRDLNLQILPKRLLVKLKNGETIMEGELCNKCKVNEAIWSLGKGKLEIHLEKCQEVWWNCLLTSEPRLDIQKMDCSRPFEELPEETQAKIEELQWNQERKRLGLPTSEQLAMQQTLKKAWNAEGSPFSGPFDPNAVIFH